MWTGNRKEYVRREGGEGGVAGGGMFMGEQKKTEKGKKRETRVGVM